MAEDSSNCDIPIPINIGCQDLLELKCTHCGWLRKRRTLSLFSWPQAYVVLHEGCLYYFKNERSRAAAGKFSMYGYNAVYRASEILPKEAPWCFKIVHSHQEFKTYYFSASSEQEMKVWMSKIKLEMLHANGKSAIYGKKLQHVKEEKPDKMFDDPSFYQNIEENIYDDNSKFVPGQDYQKQCSIKRINEDSEDEEIETVETNPSIDNRPPLPLPVGQGPFMKSPSADTPPLPPPTKPPVKPPRIVESKKPLTPPGRRKCPPDPLQDTSEKNSVNGSNGGVQTRIGKLALNIEQQLDNKRPKPPVSPKPGRPKRRNQDEPLRNSKEYTLVAPREGHSEGQSEPRGSYEQTYGPGNKSPSVGRHGFIPVADDSGEGSTARSDEKWSDIYFDEQNKQKANEILQRIGEDGVFLVRPENSGDGMVLVVFVKDHSRKYRIMKENGEYFIHREDFRHRSVNTLIKHYYQNHLPTMSLMLKVPYKLHPAYKNLDFSELNTENSRD